MFINRIREIKGALQITRYNKEGLALMGSKTTGF